MSSSMWKPVFDVANNLVWVAFVYLGYRAVLIVLESFRRRRVLRELAREVRAIRQQVEPLLSMPGKDAGLTRKEFQSVVQTRLARVWEWVQSVELAELLPRLCHAVLNRLEDEAQDLIEHFLAERQGRTAIEQNFKDRCLQNGCLGTVLGLWSAFSFTDRKEIPLAALGFALGTTAVGLVLAAAIDLSLTLTFENAWCDLRDELEETRHVWRRRWRDRIQSLPDPSVEAEQIQQLRVEIGQMQKSWSGLSDALEIVLLQLPSQMAKELAAFADSPVPLLDEHPKKTPAKFSHPTIKGVAS